MNSAKQYNNVFQRSAERQKARKMDVWKTGKTERQIGERQKDELSDEQYLNLFQRLAERWKGRMTERQKDWKIKKT